MEIINHEYYVSLEVAKLLKEAGFDWKCRGYFDNTEFHPNGSVECTNYNSSTCKYLKVPVLEVAQRWLREVKNIDVYIFPTTNTKRECVYQVRIKTFGRTLWIPGHPSTTEYAIYEEAQEAGIKKALELILEKRG